MVVKSSKNVAAQIIRMIRNKIKYHSRGAQQEDMSAEPVSQQVESRFMN